MLLQCTKKLLAELQIKPTLDQAQEELPLFSWHANLITVNRKKTLVLVNDSSYYIIVLYGLKAKDFQNLEPFIKDAIRETLLGEGIKAEIVQEYLKQAAGLSYAKTKDRVKVAKMNKACETIGFFAEDEFQPDSKKQSGISIRASKMLIGDGKGDYFQPNECLYQDLQAWAGQSIFGGKAIQFQVTLELDGQQVWRRVAVPNHITFKKLHDMLQVVFGWQDCHLHEFFIFKGKNPIVNLVCNIEDDLVGEDEVPKLAETDVKLAEYIPKYSKIKYVYDLGDSWEHDLEVEKIIDNFDQNYAICLDGVGNTPPEDVGGPIGFREFLKVFSDPEHPEHEDMVAWGKAQGYKDFDPKMVNWKLKNY
jgi:hypothetical protein